MAGQITLFEDEKRIDESAEKAIVSYSFHKKKSEEKEERQEKSSFVSVDLNSVAKIEFKS
ncbi:hypothetical protein [Oceanobacillus salinisoli]|uniref:hypothetical protein n=1 Tax=Oceanobacillus salinisoli TaxID=2678611 RepID=UPI0012E30F94|nr:hypothetical protein [Oceanobacillus salinisoli]